MPAFRHLLDGQHCILVQALFAIAQVTAKTWDDAVRNPVLLESLQKRIVMHFLALVPAHIQTRHNVQPVSFPKFYHYFQVFNDTKILISLILLYHIFLQVNHDNLSTYSKTALKASPHNPKFRFDQRVLNQSIFIRKLELQFYLHILLNLLWIIFLLTLI